MIMNGKLTVDATDLDTSRTLRAVIDAPFLDPESKIETLYLATFTRKPKASELKFLLNHVRAEHDNQQRGRAYAEVFWGMLNSPEFVLCR